MATYNIRLLIIGIWYTARCPHKIIIKFTARIFSTSYSYFIDSTESCISSRTVILCLLIGCTINALCHDFRFSPDVTSISFYPIRFSRIRTTADSVLREFRYNIHFFTAFINVVTTTTRNKCISNKIGRPWYSWRSTGVVITFNFILLKNGLR